jgi:UDP-N-acetylglucosamine--N-acetylmuramyl-(pentapeptide) pyrophosphoryl-undecaprenol N-acetylglucosamine transferase
MRILFVAGGSGGHIYPAFALMQELRHVNRDIDFIFVISRRVAEKHIINYFKETDFKFTVKTVSLLPLQGKDIFSRVDFLTRLLLAGFQALYIVVSKRPKVVIGFGGYLSGPFIVAAFLSGIPSLIHEQNVYPGRANSILAYIATRIALSFTVSQAYFRKKSRLVVTGNPLRPDIKIIDKKTATEVLGLNPQLFTILVLGGSQGSGAINKKIGAVLEKIKASGMNLQFIHITGERDFAWVSQTYKQLGLTAKVFAFCTDMNFVYGCVDLVITRAGATTLNELAYLGKAAIAIPYPYAGAHQLFNAQYYSLKEALMVIEEKALSSELLFVHICEIIRNRDRADLLSKRIRHLYSPDAAKLLAEETRSLMYA